VEQIHGSLFLKNQGMSGNSVLAGMPGNFIWWLGGNPEIVKCKVVVIADKMPFNLLAS